MDLIIKNKEFKFIKIGQISLNQETVELSVSDHIEEFRQRFFQVLGFALFSISVIFIKITLIVEFLEIPVKEIKFIQLSPGEYFLSTVKIAFYGGLLSSLPFLISQLILYILPGLTQSEKKYIPPILIASVILFNSGLLFAYYVLIPAAVTFFINYSKNIIETLWSFDQYFDFVLFLFYSTGVSFQVPIIQIIAGLTGLISGKQMFYYWRYVILITTIISAVLTPSTDPITQLCLSIAILFLYFIGATVLVIYRR